MTVDDGPEHVRLVCLGFGYTARALARLVDAEAGIVTGTSRGSEGVRAMAALGLTGVLWEGGGLSNPLSDAIGEATHILVSVPPGDTGDVVLSSLRGPLAAAGIKTWIGYLSTVGVYGDHGGRWVSELTPARPSGERSRRRLLAEEQWLEFSQATGQRVEIFRLPGIYGPGRSALDALRAGTARRIVKPGQVFNRIHVSDMARALRAIWSVGHRHVIYNLTDDEPAPPQDVITHAAGLLGMEPPAAVPFEAADLSPMARSFYAESKRVDNSRLRSVPGFALCYPTYREGLAAIARDGS
jgi:dTDP-4-dehydrorhamnose reductase